MRIGELAKQSGVSKDTIRFYERFGLITSSASNTQTNRYREYSEDALFTIDLIADAQAAGLTIAEFSMILAQLNAQTDDDFDGEAFLTEKITQVQTRIEQSKRFLTTLKQTRKALRHATRKPSPL